MKTRKRRIKQYTDKRFAYFSDVTELVLDEHHAQISKWGIQTHSMFEWLAYTTEELGELAKAISEQEYRGGSKEDVIKEAIQVATLSLKIAEMMRESHNENS